MRSEIASQPDSYHYLNPVNLNASQVNSLPSVDETVIEESKKKVNTPSPKKLKIRQNTESIATEAAIESTLLHEASPMILTKGIFSLPKNNYEMKVSIYPKTLTFRQSVHVSKYSMLGHEKFVTERSPHFSFEA